jgi:hypothetical protein
MGAGAPVSGRPDQKVIFAASCTMRLSAAPMSSPKLVSGMSTLARVS